jgi:hypothetical protein
MVLQSVKPFMSDASIEKGARGLDEIAGALEIKVGISCLTPDNLTAPWINYEAGALSKTVGTSKLCTYLLCGLKKSDVPPPLGQFQHSLPDYDDTLEMLRSINKAVGADDALDDKTLVNIFKQCWPILDAALREIPAAKAPKPTHRSVEDMLAEILQFTRGEINRRHDMEANRRWEQAARKAYDEDVRAKDQARFEELKRQMRIHNPELDGDLAQLLKEARKKIESPREPDKG